jgi:amidohydrolase
MELKERIKELARKQHDYVVGVRRHLHAHPELSFAEHNTAAHIAAQLDKAGVPYQTGVAGTGIVALVEGKKTAGAGTVVALRADMDALPINELNEVEYKSQNEGVMHACGHDVHSASLIGVAGILAELRDDFGGTVKLIFQPGEEKLPGGASLMIGEGVLKNPAPVSITGQHVMPLIDAGMVGFRQGLYMASTDELYLTVKGKGGHGAMPHLGADPVLMAAHIITDCNR